MHVSIRVEIKTSTIKHDRVGDWFITIVAQAGGAPDEMENANNSEHEPVKPIDIDPGLKSIITTCDEIYTEPPEYQRKSEKK